PGAQELPVRLDVLAVDLGADGAQAQAQRAIEGGAPPAERVEQRQGAVEETGAAGRQGRRQVDQQGGELLVGLARVARDRLEVPGWCSTAGSSRGHSSGAADAAGALCS